MLNVEPSNLVFLKTYNTEFNEIVITFTAQNSRPLEIESKVILTFLINEWRRSSSLATRRYSIEPKRIKYVTGYKFLTFARNLCNKYKIQLKINK